MPQRFMKCVGCGHGEWHDAEKSYARPVGKKCSACEREHDADLPAPVRTFSIGGKPWGNEGRSLKFAFDPSAIRDIGQTCPTLAQAIDPDDGTVRFENDSHQKRVYAEMASEKARINEERAGKVADYTGAFFKPSAVNVPIDDGRGDDGGDDGDEGGVEDAAMAAVSAE